MPDYRMDVKGDLGLNEYGNIFDYMNVIDKDDSFTITLNGIGEREKSIITSMLRDGNFMIMKEGFDPKGQYYINANKYK